MVYGPNCCERRNWISVATWLYKTRLSLYWVALVFFQNLLKLTKIFSTTKQKTFIFPQLFLKILHLFVLNYFFNCRVRGEWSSKTVIMARPYLKKLDFGLGSLLKYAWNNETKSGLPKYFAICDFIFVFNSFYPTT